MFSIKLTKSEPAQWDDSSIKCPNCDEVISIEDENSYGYTEEVICPHCKHEFELCMEIKRTYTAIN